MDGDIRTFVIPHGFDEQRLDQVLVHIWPEQSRNAIAKAIRDGRVTVNALPVLKPSQRVRADQIVRVEVLPPAATSIEPQSIPLQIVFEDAAIAVIDKPAGLVIHPAPGHWNGTLVNAALFQIRNLSGVGGELRPGIVHRLDKETSGLIVIAKHDLAHRALTAQWSSRSVIKEYLAIIYGTPKPADGTINVPIGRDPRDRKKMAVVEGGRAAVTHYRVVETLRYASVVRCRLETGRTHQIRIHLKSIGHPIIGDPLYSGPQWKGIPDRKLQKSIAEFSRQALHAARLDLVHPITRVAMSFESPLPQDMQELLGALREGQVTRDK